MNNSSWSTTIPTGINAKNYDVYWRLVGDTNHTDVASQKITVTIAKQGIPRVTGKTTSFDYTGNEITVLVNNYDSNKITVNGNKGTNAGNYTATYTPMSNFQWNSGSSTTSGITINWTINKVAPVYTTPKVNNSLVYNEASQKLLTAGTATGGYFEYSLDGTSWSNSVPEKLNAGTYQVYYRFVPDANHTGLGNATSVSVVIKKAKSEDTIEIMPTANNSTYDGAMHNIITPGRVRAGTLQYKVTGTTANSLAYQGYFDSEKIKTLGYSSNSEKFAISLGYSLTDPGWSTDVPQASMPCDYTVEWRIVGNENYEDYAGSSVTSSITKPTPNITVIAETGLVYNGTSNDNGTSQVLIKGPATIDLSLPGNVEITYSVDGGPATSELPTAINAGIHRVTVIVTGDNYSQASKTIEVEIARKGIERVTGKPSSFVYNGKTKRVEVNNYNSDQIQVSGTYEAILEGSYTANFTPLSNFQWKDGSNTTSAISIQWSIQGVNHETQDITNTDAVTLNVKTDTLISYTMDVIAGDFVIKVVSNGEPITVEKIGLTPISNVDHNDYIVDGLISSVKLGNQNRYLTSNQDIRGVFHTANHNCFIDTYATLPWANGNYGANPITQFPLTSTVNNVSILQDQNVLVGYKLYASIGTIGNYFVNGTTLQVIPEYYGVDTKTGEIFPVDVYINYNNSYYPVNIWGLATGEDVYTWGGEGSGYNIATVYNYMISLKWAEEYMRRMATAAEIYETDEVKAIMAEQTSEVLFTPGPSEYVMGNAQFMQLNGKARTFVGGETTYGDLKNGSLGKPIHGGNTTLYQSTNGILQNPEGRISYVHWFKYGQRWHFTLALPTSSVFVKAGEKLTLNNINSLSDKKYKILATADLRAIGEVWNLRYTSPSYSADLIDPDGNPVNVPIPTTIDINGHSHVIPFGISILDKYQTPPDDIDIISTH